MGQQNGWVTAKGTAHFYTWGDRSNAPLLVKGRVPMTSAFGRFTSFAMVAMTAVFLACEESPTALDSQALSAESAQLSSHAGNPVVLGASGSGHAQATRTVGWRTFSFTASQRADGTTVTGHAQFNNRGEGVIQHGNAICMRDLGKTVPAVDGWIILGFEGTQRIGPAPLPLPPGITLPPADLDGVYGFVTVVRDNGEGAAAAADQITGAVLTSMPAVLGICGGLLDAQAPVLLNPAAGLVSDIEAGNIQVNR